MIERHRPFVLWLCNFISHIDFNIYIDSKEGGIGRWAEGYKYFDKEVRYIFELLKDKNLLSSTSIIFYGDHGDDIYSHGYHEGLTHAIRDAV